MTTQQNHLATPDDFRQAALACPAPERVVLPKLGKPVMLRKPAPMWFLLRGLLPSELALRLDGREGGARLETADELRAFAQWLVPLLQEVFISPRLVWPEPAGADEISPDLLAIEDVNFVVRWAMGLAEVEGADLLSFRGPGESTAGRASGGGVSPAAGNLARGA